MAYTAPRIGWLRIGNALTHELTDNLIKLRRVLQERRVAAVLVLVRDLDPHPRAVGLVLHQLHPGDTRSPCRTL